MEVVGVGCGLLFIIVPSLGLVLFSFIINGVKNRP